MDHEQGCTYPQRERIGWLRYRTVPCDECPSCSRRIERGLRAAADGPDRAQADEPAAAGPPDPVADAS
jgi:hypothetical protein